MNRTNSDPPKKGLRSWVSPRNILILFVLINLFIGVFIAGDYGNITDEEFEIAREIYALEMYSIPSIDEPPRLKEAKSELVLKYGTTLSMFFQLAENLFRPVFHSPPRVIAHYMYFVVFQAGVIAFYYLAQRFTKPWLALATTILFATQPLYFGHAFINPKDTPLMAIFLITIASGIRMVEQYYPDPGDAKPAANKHIVDAFQKAGHILFGGRAWLLALNLLALVLVLYSGAGKVLLTSIVSWLYQTPQSSCIGQIFSLFARQRLNIPEAVYIDKIHFLYNRFTIGSLIGLAVTQLILIGGLVIHDLVKSDGLGWQQYIAALKKTCLNRGSKCLIHAQDQTQRHQGRWIKLIAAGILWGVCMGTRSIGIAAGGLVALYFFLRAGKKAVIPLFAYTSISAAALYLLWPYLWRGQVNTFFDVVQLLSDFPHPSTVLFNGEFYLSNRLPSVYLPVLLSIQFSEPAVLLAAGGLLISSYLCLTGEINRPLLLLLFCWLFVPLMYVITSHTPLYNNFRHLLFVTPPLFLFAGITLQQLSRCFSRKWVVMVLVIALIFPGISELVRIHPFQYVYYNGFVGGVKGAHRNFETDYWITSLKYAAEYINQTAPEGTKVSVFFVGQQLSQNYLRPDIELISSEELLALEYPPVDLVVLPTRLNADLEFFIDSDVIHQITVDGIPLAVIKSIRSP